MLLISAILLLQVGISIPYTTKPVPQAVQERVFVQEKQPQKLAEILLDSTIYMPGMIKSFYGALYVLDYKPFPAVKKLSRDYNRVIETYGSGAGRGPGELINPTDFTVTENEKVWISDQPQSKLTVFKKDGSLFNDWAIKFMPYKMTGYENNVAVYGSHEPVIKLIDEKRNVLWTSKPVVKEPRVWANLITGFLVSDRQNIYNLSNYTATIAAYDQQGKRLFFRELVAPSQSVSGTPIEDLDYLSYQVDRSELDFAIVTAFIIRDRLHTLVQFYGENRYQVIDVYSTSGGEYLHSYKLDESVRSITATEDGTIVGLKPDRLIFWK